MNQQSISFEVIVKGDGTSTSFSCDLGAVYGLHFPPNNPSGGTSLQSNSLFVPLDPNVIPDAVTVDFTTPNQGGVTASLSRRKITLTFPAVFTGLVTVGMEMLFN